MDGEDSVNEEMARKKASVAKADAILDEQDRKIEALRDENAQLKKDGADSLAGCNRAYDELAVVEQLKSNFLAVVSHELRTPLTTLLGYLDLMLRGVGGPLTPRQDHYLKMSMTSARDLSSLINGIIELSVLDAEQLTPRLIEVKLAEATESLLASMQSTAADRGVELASRIDIDCPSVKADELLLRRALETLLSNALKFTPAGGSIIIDACPSAGCVTIDVEDTGIGVPTEELARIWDKFYQVDSSPSRKFGGLGLGLAIVRRLVEIQGGRTWAESRGPELGSNFKIELPQWEA